MEQTDGKAYSGGESRPAVSLLSLGTQRKFMSRMKNLLKDIPDVNVYLQHQPLIVELLDKIFAGSLSGYQC